MGEMLDGLHQSAAFHWRHANVCEILLSKHLEVLEVVLSRSEQNEGHAILLLQVNVVPLLELVDVLEIGARDIKDLLKRDMRECSQARNLTAETISLHES